MFFFLPFSNDALFPCPLWHRMFQYKYYYLSFSSPKLFDIFLTLLMEWDKLLDFPSFPYELFSALHYKIPLSKDFMMPCLKTIYSKQPAISTELQNKCSLIVSQIYILLWFVLVLTNLFFFRYLILQHNQCNCDWQRRGVW